MNHDRSRMQAVEAIRVLRYEGMYSYCLGRYRGMILYDMYDKSGQSLVSH